MFARVVRGVAREGQVNELVRAVQESVIPKVREQPGSRGLLLLTDAGSGQVISISLWESQEAMVAGETSDYLAGLIEEVSSMLEETPSVSDFQVSARV